MRDRTARHQRLRRSPRQTSQRRRRHTGDPAQRPEVLMPAVLLHILGRRRIFSALGAPRRPSVLAAGSSRCLAASPCWQRRACSSAKGHPLNLLNVGLGILCLASGVVALMVRGWVRSSSGALLSAGVFALCGLKLYQTVQWLQTQASTEAVAWTLQNGGIVWIGGLMLGMAAFTKTFRSLFRR